MGVFPEEERRPDMLSVLVKAVVQSPLRYSPETLPSVSARPSQTPTLSRT